MPPETLVYGSSLYNLCRYIQERLATFQYALALNYSVSGLRDTIPRGSVRIGVRTSEDFVRIATRYNGLLKDLRTLFNLYDNQ
jgi:hypothetical protein